MKRKKLVVFNILLVSGVLASLGAQPANAQTYPDALNGIGDGSITFSGDDDSQVPSPTDPDTPVTPDKPNTNDGDLKIVYVPDFVFGSHAKSVAGVSAYAQLISLASPATKTVPFVTTKDLRTERGKGWELAVKASTFKDANSHEIKGAVVSLEGAGYATDTAANGQGVFPKVAAQSIALEPNSSVKVASADASSTVANGNQGIGMYSLALGTAQSDGTTNGVKFTLPKNTAVNDGTYTATFQWTIAPVL